jgi:hypothetical protein
MTRIDHDVATTEKTLQVAVGDSSLGRILVASSEKGISAILFGSDRDALVAELRAEFPHAGFVEVEEDQSEVFAKVVRLVESPPVVSICRSTSPAASSSGASGRRSRRSRWARRQTMPRLPAGSAHPTPSARWRRLAGPTGWRW